MTAEENRERARRFMAKLRGERKAKGLCPRCGVREWDGAERAECNACRSFASRKGKARRAKAKADGGGSVTEEQRNPSGGNP